MRMRWKTVTGPDFEKIAAAFSAYGPRITLHGPFIDLSAGSKDPRIRDVTRQRLVRSSTLSRYSSPLPWFAMQATMPSVMPSSRKNGSRTAWTHGPGLPGSSMRMGVRLMLENVYEQDPLDLLVLLKGLDRENVGICLDIGHLWSFGKSTPQMWLDALGDFIGQFHLHDNDRTFDQHLGMGAGSIDFEPVWRYIRSRKRRSSDYYAWNRTKRGIC
jgi:hypothetical protein